MAAWQRGAATQAAAGLQLKEAVTAWGRSLVPSAVLLAVQAPQSWGGLPLEQSPFFAVGSEPQLTQIQQLQVLQMVAVLIKDWQ